ncbi:unnamed protein product, partial [Didymodactylos carnosus]
VANPKLSHNQMIQLALPTKKNKHLSMAEQMNRNQHQQLSCTIDNNDKIINIARRKSSHIYELQSNQILLCFTKIENDCHYLIFSSIIKITNNLTLPLDVLHPENGSVVATITPDDTYCLPMSLLYYDHTSTEIYFSISHNENISKFSLNWNDNHPILYDTLNVNRDLNYYIVICKETIKAYSENTNNMSRHCGFHFFIQSGLTVQNLLPYELQLYDDDNETPLLSLGPTEKQAIINRNKDASFKFRLCTTLEVYYTSTKKQLGDEKTELEFSNSTSTKKLYASVISSIFRGVHHIIIYSYYWILNKTGLNLLLKTLVCVAINAQSPKSDIKILSRAQTIQCKAANNQIYNLLITIKQSSFSKTEVITISSATVIFNNSSFKLDVEYIETNNVYRQQLFLDINSTNPLWSSSLNEGILRIKLHTDTEIVQVYLTETPSRTLLNMGNEININIELKKTKLNSYHIILTDSHTINDVPILIINRNKFPITYCQNHNNELLKCPPESYVYHTSNYLNELDRYVSITHNNQSYKIDNHKIPNFSTDYIQLFDHVHRIVYLFANKKYLNNVWKLVSLAYKFNNCVQLNIAHLGLSIVNDLKCQEIAYITVRNAYVTYDWSKKEDRLKATVNQLQVGYQNFYVERVLQFKES